MKPFFLALIFLLAFSGGARADLPVTLRAQAEIEGREVRLSDIFANVPADKDRAVGLAPVPGKSVTYDARILTNLAGSNRLEWTPSGDFDRITVTRLAKYLSEDKLRNAILEKLAERDEANPTKARLSVQVDGRNWAVPLPADREPVFALNNFAYDVARKKFRAELRIETGAAPYLMAIAGRVTVSRDVPVLTRRVEPGETITATDIDWLTLPEERIGPDVVVSVDELTNRALRRGGNPGQPVFSRDVIAPRLVTRGSLVVLKVETPMMLVTAQGRALGDGAKGEVVRVTNTQSNRTVEGVVEAAGVVRIHTVTQQLAAVKE